MSIDFKATIRKIKLDSQQLKDQITSIKTDNTTSYYLGNLRRLALQALDLFNAMEKQTSLLDNQIRINSIKQNIVKQRRIQRSIDE